MYEKIQEIEPEISIYNPLVEEINKMIHVQNKNCLMCVAGETGSGKSFFALETADEFDPTFRDNIKERVVFTPSKFKKVLNIGRLAQLV